VIGHLDQLLGRTPVIERSSPPLDDLLGHDDVQQRVMLDLSFASVYEVPDSLSSASSIRSDVTTELVDSGVESNKSDADDHPDPPNLRHDYQNVTVAAPQPRLHSRRRHYRSSAAAAAATAPVTLPINKPSELSNKTKEDKFYEICLGHLCHRMDAGPDGWISIFSLQKHQDELIQVSGQQHGSSSSGNRPASSHHHGSTSSSSGPIRQPSNEEHQPSSSSSSSMVNSRNNGEFALLLSVSLSILAVGISLYLLHRFLFYLVSLSLSPFCCAEYFCIYTWMKPCVSPRGSILIPNAGRHSSISFPALDSAASAEIISFPRARCVKDVYCTYRSVPRFRYTPQ